MMPFRDNGKTCKGFTWQDSVVLLTFKSRTKIKKYLYFLNVGEWKNLNEKDIDIVAVAEISKEWPVVEMNLLPLCTNVCAYVHIMPALPEGNTMFWFLNDARHNKSK